MKTLNGIVFNPIPKGRSLARVNSNLPFGIGLNILPFSES